MMTVSAHAGHAQVASGRAYFIDTTCRTRSRGGRRPENDEKSAGQTRSTQRRVSGLRPEERRYLRGRIRRQAKRNSLTYSVVLLILGLIESVPVFVVIGGAVVAYAFGYVLRLRMSDSLPLINGADRGQRRLIREALRTGHSADRVTNALIAAARKQARANVFPAMVLFGVIEAATLLWVCSHPFAPTALRIFGAACAAGIAWSAILTVIRLRRLRDYRVNAVSS